MTTPTVLVFQPILLDKVHSILLTMSRCVVHPAHKDLRPRVNWGLLSGNVQCWKQCRGGCLWQALESERKNRFQETLPVRWWGHWRRGAETFVTMDSGSGTPRSVV